ncbi:MAG: TetR/AcrR family transcriptional regulator [Planctomycetota bacterium]
MAHADTREIVLDAAELLFADQGYAATSLRGITAAAGVNLAAVNYHFGSKEELAKAVLARRIAPINDERLRRLDALAPSRRTVAAIVRAFVEPPLRASGAACSGDSPPSRMCRVFGRISVEQPPFLRDFLAAQFRGVARRFAAALATAAPGMTMAATWWRLHFLIGAMAHTMLHSGLLARLSDGQCDPDDVDGMIEHLVAFAVGGLRASARRRPHRRSGAAS